MEYIKSRASQPTLPVYPAHESSILPFDVSAVETQYCLGPTVDTGKCLVIIMLPFRANPSDHEGLDT